MQKSSKAATAALLTLLFTACTAESQGSPGAQAAAALNASQLIAAATDPALVSQQVVELAVSAAGPGLAVSSSQELWQALQSADDSSGITSIVLQGSVALEAGNWTKVLIPAGRVVVIRSHLRPDGLNVTSSPDAIPLAGAPTLNMGQIAEALVVDTGAMLVLQGMVLNNQAYTAAWIARSASAAQRGEPVEPGNLGVNPSIICRAGCMLPHRDMFINYFMPDCSADIVAGNVYRGSLLLQSAGATATLHQLNDTAYAVLGSASVDVSLLLPNGSSPGKAHADSVDTVYNCQADPTANASPATTPADAGGGGGGGTAAWVWVLVALAAVFGLAAAAAGALLFLRRRRRCLKGTIAVEGPGSPASSLVMVGQAGSGDALTKSSASARRSLSKADEDDLEKAGSGHEGGVLQEVWSSRSSSATHDVALLEPLARGGFAVVWKARWKGITVAAKLIEHALSEGDFEAARAEAALSASVAHPNVVSTYAVHTLSLADLAELQAAAEQPAGGLLPSAADGAEPGLGATLIVQEMCSCSVDRCIQEGILLYRPDGSPDEVAVLRMLMDAAQGLEYLASAGVVHGDVKAANVLISTGCGTKRGWQAKIADLGLSRLLPPNASSMDGKKQTGTAAYMAPEVISCARITRAADVYAFGILMYEVWSRHRAWSGLSMARMSFEVVSRQRRPPIPPSCPPAYVALMERCWTQVPEDRPTMQAVLQSLQAMLRPLLPAAGAAGQRSPRSAAPAAVQPAAAGSTKSL